MPTPAPAPIPTPSPPPPSPPPPPPLDTFSRDLLSATNEARAHEGLPPLSLNSALTSTAQAYAAVLAQHDWFDHAGPDGSTLVARAESAGYTGGWLGEVLYMGPINFAPTAVATTWLDRAGHRSVLLSKQYTEIGVGCAVAADMRWCVEDFGAR